MLWWLHPSGRNCIWGIIQTSYDHMVVLGVIDIDDIKHFHVFVSR